MNDWHEAEQLVEKAHDLYEAGRWDEAESALRSALALNPYQSEWHFNLGLTLEAAGRYEAAVDAFREAAKLQGADGQAALLAGVNLLRIEQTEEALEWLDRAERAEPKSAAPFVHRIDAYSRLGKHDQAEVMFFMGQELEPENAELYGAMAESLLDRRLFDKAVWCLREAVRLDAEMPRAQARLAYAYSATGRLERARQLYLRELRMNPGDIDTLLDLGGLLVEMHRYTEAGEKFRRVLEIEPDNPDAHFSLGDLAERQGMTDEALTQFDVALRLDPGYPEVRLRAASQHLARNGATDMKDARRLLRAELLETEGAEHDPDHLTTLGTLCLDAEMPGESARVFRALLALRPNDAQAHHHLSVAYFRVGDLSRGIESARSALRLDPRCVPAMHNLAVANLRRRQVTRARYWVDQALRIEPDDAALRRLRLRLHWRVFAGVAGWAFSGLRRR